MIKKDVGEQDEERFLVALYFYGVHVRVRRTAKIDAPGQLPKRQWQIRHNL
jgi:hypothetical protein